MAGGQTLGAGRDPRLTNLPEAPANAPHPFRTALAAAFTTSPAMAQFRGTASAARDLLPLIAASSQEPTPYCAAFITASGLSPKGTVAHELKVLYWFIYSFVCSDLGDPYRACRWSTCAGGFDEGDPQVRKVPGLRRAPPLPGAHGRRRGGGSDRYPRLADCESPARRGLRAQTAAVGQGKQKETIEKKKKTPMGGGKNNEE